jgi:hypothetical protein
MDLQVCSSQMWGYSVRWERILSELVGTVQRLYDSIVANKWLVVLLLLPP